MNKKKLTKRIAQLDHKLDQALEDLRWLREAFEAQIAAAEAEPIILKEEAYVPIVEPGT